MPHAQITLLRHGQSVWNKEGRFTGWEDISLATEGEVEAKKAAVKLKLAGVNFDCCFTSYLKRAIKTLWIVAEEMNLMWIPQYADWRFNERHYGALQGMTKSKATERYGEEQVYLWRRSFLSSPPLAENPPEVDDNRYRNLTLPVGESLQKVGERTGLAYDERIVPLLKEGKSVLLVAHGNSLRSLIKKIEKISDEDIVNVELLTAVPILYELDQNLSPVSKWILKEN